MSIVSQTPCACLHGVAGEVVPVTVHLLSSSRIRGKVALGDVVLVDVEVELPVVCVSTILDNSAGSGLSLSMLSRGSSVSTKVIYSRAVEERVRVVAQLPSGVVEVGAVCSCRDSAAHAQEGHGLVRQVVNVVEAESGPLVVGVQGGELDLANSSGSNGLAVDNSELLGLRGVDLLEVVDVGADVLARSAVHHE